MKMNRRAFLQALTATGAAVAFPAVAMIAPPKLPATGAAAAGDFAAGTFTAPTAGVYEFSVSVTFTKASNGFDLVTPSQTFVRRGNFIAGEVLDLNAVFDLDAGDELEIPGSFKIRKIG